MSSQVTSASWASNGRPETRWVDAGRFCVLALLAALVVGPQIALALEALRNAEIRAILAERPAIALQLSIALLFWIGLFAWPLGRLAKALTAKGKVTIARGLVHYVRPLRSGHETWSLPISTYRGIAHRVRSTVSGLEHALVLEHANPARSVSLLVAEHIDSAETARLSATLRLPQISAAAGFIGAHDAPLGAA